VLTRVPRMLADNSGRITGNPEGMQVADYSDNASSLSPFPVAGKSARVSARSLMESWQDRWSACSWRTFLATGETESELTTIRQSTHTGRPLWTREFIGSKCTVAWPRKSADGQERSLQKISNVRWCSNSSRPTISISKEHSRKRPSR
jgi:hypothetical protein